MNPYLEQTMNQNRLLNLIMIILIHILRNIATRFHSEEVIESSSKLHMNATSAVALAIGVTSIQMVLMKVHARIRICGVTNVAMVQRSMDFVNGKILKHG